MELLPLPLPLLLLLLLQEALLRGTDSWAADL